MFLKGKRIMNSFLDFLKAKLYYNISYDKVMALHLTVDKLRGKEQCYQQDRKIVHKDNEKIVVVFCGQMPSLWSGLRSVYESALKNENLNVYLLALPEKKGFDDELWKEEYQDNKEFVFLKSLGYDVIDAYKDNKWFPLETLNPDFVFLERPYDIQIPPVYRSSVIKSFTRVCYVPYSYSLTPWTNRTIYNLEFLLNTDLVFCENKNIAQTINRIFKTYKFADKKAFGFGFSRFDRYKTEKYIFEKKFEKTVLWMPRWSLNADIESTTFFMYSKTIIDFFLSNKNIRLICRPHPYMLRYFIESKLMTQEEQNDFLSLFEKNKNFYLDQDGDYYYSLREADIVISDYTSLVTEILLQEKPILYCGKRPRFLKELQGIDKCLYYIEDNNELINYLETLLSGDNPKIMDIKSFSNSILKCDDAIAGERIVDAIVDYYNNNR